MKKLFAYLAVFGMMSFGSVAMAQDENAAADATEQAAPAAVEEAAAPAGEVAEAPVTTPTDEEKSLHQVLKEQFVEGGVG